MPVENPLLTLDRISKRYEQTDDGQSPPVLVEVNLNMAAGESLAIIGPSGCGKSTLLNIIGTLDRPTSGTVLFDGRNLTKLDEAELARIRNRSIGFVFQEHHLLPQCTVLENILVPTLVNAASPNNVEARAERLLERVELTAKMHKRPGQLSGGQRQRVAVVRALINEPKLLLADEPTGSLDRESAKNLAELLVELNREEGVTLIMVTHSLKIARMMRHVYELRDGMLKRRD